MLYTCDIDVDMCLTLICEIFEQIRSDTSQIVNENLPQIQRKSEEMREIYRKIDKLEVLL